MRVLATGSAVIAAMFLLSAPAFSQPAVAGTVRDSSGGILPGVSVEASSPVLIEKSRTVVTDGSGQYRIVDLKPGTYSVAFTLSGFATTRREGIELSGAGVTTINADMRVGAVSETVTVTGETPVVDIQTSTKREVVLSNEVLAAVPASRTYGNILALVPGVQSLTLDVNSTQSVTGTATNFFFTSRGGRGQEGTVQVDGMNVGSAFGGGGVSSFAYDFVNAQEVQVTVAGGMGESDRGGPAFNIIPKTGGNTFSGTAFASTAGKWSQGSNLDDRLRSVGITEPPGLIRNYDTNLAIGGPIKRDRLWFFNNLRTYGSSQDIPGVYANANASDPAQWRYLKDPNVKARSVSDKKIEAVRLTGQVTPRNKVGFYYDYQANCAGSALVNTGDACRDRGDDWIGLGTSTTSPESANMWPEREKITQATWSSPITSRLLFEAGVSSFSSKWGGYIPPGSATGLVAVTEQSTAAGVPNPNFVYRGWNSAASNNQQHNVWRASLNYVTGAHSFKVGYQAAYEVYRQYQNVDNQLSYTFNNGTPTQFTMRIGPHIQSNRTRYDGIYAQDQWTRGRLTLQGALRYEHASSFFPGDENGISADNRFGSRLIFPRQDGVTGYNDITPRMGAAFDLFGNGKTSVKVNFSRYLETAQNGNLYTINNPAVTFQQTTARSWTDGNGNFVPDCDLMNPAQQNNLASGGDNCGVWNNSNFGNPFVTVRVNPEVQHGWGVRPDDWQFGVALQQQILPRVALDISYNRRWWGNFFFTDNLALGPQDFDQVTIAAPANPNLPGGGGYPVPFLTRNARTALGATDNYYTFASDYGDITTYWHGVDAQLSARLSNRLFAQIGASGGRGVRDYCAVADKLPELYTTAGALLVNQQLGMCAVSEDWLTSIRGLASYTIPKVDVLISGSVRSLPAVAPAGTSVASNGASLAANYNVSSAILQQQIGRPLTTGLAFQTVNLLPQGHLFPDRLNSLDIRAGKILKFGRTRTNIAIDLYNVFNSNTGTVYNQTYDPVTNGATWLAPTTVLNPRFARFNVTVDF
ncbi:MAG: carboxypeptidase regulatory-like domain-containing protein [Acidobacteriota bacterium]